MKKICVLLIMLFFVSLNFSPLSLAAKDKKTNGNHENQEENPPNPQPGLFLASPFSYFSSLHPVLPSLFFPDLRVKFKLLADSDQFHRLKIRIPKKRFGRAVLEGLGHIGYATASYWIRQDVMKEDWEYQLTWKDQKRRFLFIDGMRFDSNTFQFNWTHSLAGAMYYNYARGNRLTPLQSFLFSFGASYFWEFVVEFKEVVSINDMIATPMGGVSIGESIFQLGRFFRSKRPTFLNRVASIVSNPILSLNELLDGKKYKNQYTFDYDYWSDCGLFIGPRFDNFASNGSHSFFQVGLDSQINLIPGYGEPEVSARAIKSTAFTEFNVGGVFNRKGLYEMNIFAKSVLFGYFNQNIRVASTPAAGSNGQDQAGSEYHTGLRDIDNHDSSGYQGYSFFLGAASCFDFIKKGPLLLGDNTEQETSSDLPDQEDKYCIINLLGPTVDFSLFKKDFKVRLVADAYGDFALIHSYAYKNYSASHEFGQTKSTLRNHGYYYALGITLSSMLQVNYSHLELKGIFKYHYFDSVEGLDRFQKEMADVDDFDLKDHRWLYNISLGYQIPHTPVQLVLGLERWDRKGYIMDFVRESTERRSYFQVKYLF